MFIDIWDENNKAIKINKFSKDLINIEKYNDAVNKLVADYGIVLEGNRIKTDYYEIYFEFKQDNFTGCFNELFNNFLTLSDCFTFLISDSFEYLYESKDIDFIQITAGKKVMFKYDNRE